MIVDSRTTYSSLEVEIRLAAGEIEDALKPSGLNDIAAIFWPSAPERICVFNPACNSIHWTIATDVCFREALHAYKYMVGHARLYKKRVPRNSQPAHVDPLVSFYAADCMFRLDAFRDKLALAVLALYMIFDADERVRDLRETLQALSEVMRCGRAQDRYLDLFRTELRRLDGPDFQPVEKFRHLKVHRLDPRIEIYGVANHHGAEYLMPVTTEKAKQALKERVFSRYGDTELGEMVLEGCKVDGQYLDQRRPQHLFDYAEIENGALQAIVLAAHVYACCLKGLNESLSGILKGI